MKGGDILDFWKGGNLRKEGGGVDPEKGGGYDLPYQLCILLRNLFFDMVTNICVSQTSLTNLEKNLTRPFNVMPGTVACNSRT